MMCEFACRWSTWRQGGRFASASKLTEGRRLLEAARARTRAPPYPDRASAFILRSARVHPMLWSRRARPRGSTRRLQRHHERDHPARGAVAIVLTLIHACGVGSQWRRSLVRRLSRRPVIGLRFAPRPLVPGTAWRNHPETDPYRGTGAGRAGGCAETRPRTGALSGRSRPGVLERATATSPSGW